MWLFLAFLLVPLIEIGLFIQVGGAIGLWPTLAIVVLTAIAGTWLVRQQGLATLGKLQSGLRQGQDPTRPLAHGALILFSGALLLTPGFFTDACGFALLLPPVRDAVIGYGIARFAGKVSVFRTGPDRPASPDAPIDADYIEVDPEEPHDGTQPRGDSGWTRRP